MGIDRILELCDKCHFNKSHEGCFSQVPLKQYCGEWPAYKCLPVRGIEDISYS